MERMVISRENKKAALDLIIEETLQFQVGLAQKLRTNEEWATIFGFNKDAVKRLLHIGRQEEGLAATLQLRKTAIQRQSGSAIGIAAYANRKGVFAMTPEQLTERSRKTGLKLSREGKGIHALTQEQRQEYGRKAGLRAAELGVGCHGIDPETGISYSIIGARKAVQLGLGIHGRSREQRSLDGIKGSEVIDYRKVQYGENHYDSYFEAACASLLEKYIPGFAVVRGETYQITHGINKKIDFYVAGTFVEFNPIILSKTEGSLGAFETEEEFLDYKRKLSGLNLKLRKAYKREIKNLLKQRYYQKRRTSLNKNLDFIEKELIVVIDVGELYNDVMQRFGTRLPSQEDFTKEFTAVTNSIRTKNHLNRI